MKALFLGHPHTNGCRTAYFFPYLKERGVEPVYVDVPARGERRPFLETLPPCDILLVQRLFLTDAELRVVRGKAPRIVYDVDDPIMYRSSRHWLRFSPARRRAFRRLVEASDFVLAGTPLIAREARKYIADERVAAVPSTVDAAEYTPAQEPKPEGPPVFGWLGSAGTVKYLARLRHAIADVAKRRPDARVKIVSNRFCDFEGLPVEKKAWSKAEELDDLRSFDVALLPLSRDLWTQGKGHGKLFQYLAVGLPIVASPVGIVEEAIRHGHNGFLAHNRKEWVEALATLASDRALRLRMGAQARNSFEERYSLQAVFPAFWRGLTGRE